MPDKIILLVDDNEHDVFLTRRALEKGGITHDVVVADDGQEALDYLFGTGRHQGRDLIRMPAVIFLDLKMPRVGGFEVLKQIRANPRTRSLPVVILTASREEKDIQRSYEDGCNAYVTKPVDFDRFAEAARQLGSFWLLWNEQPPMIAE
jgi:two-component system, response regulator